MFWPEEIPAALDHVRSCLVEETFKENVKKFLEENVKKFLEENTKSLTLCSVGVTPDGRVAITLDPEKDPILFTQTQATKLAELILKKVDQAARLV